MKTKILPGIGEAQPGDKLVPVMRVYAAGKFLSDYAAKQGMSAEEFCLGAALEVELMLRNDTNPDKWDEERKEFEHKIKLIADFIAKEFADG